MNYSLEDEANAQHRNYSNLNPKKLYHSNEEPVDRRRMHSNLRPKRLDYSQDEPVRRRRYSNLGRKKLNYSLDEETSQEAFGRPVAETSRWKSIFEQPEETLVVEIGSEIDPVQAAIERRVAEYSFKKSGICANCQLYEHWLNDNDLCYECAYMEYDSMDYYDTEPNPVSSSPTYTIPTPLPPRERSINLSDLVSDYSEDEDTNPNFEIVKKFCDFVSGPMLSSTLKQKSAQNSQNHSLGIDEILDFLESYDEPRAGTPKSKPFTDHAALPIQLPENSLSSTPKPSPKPQCVRNSIAFDKPLGDLSKMTPSPMTVIDQSISPSSNFCPFSPLKSVMHRYVDPTPVMRPSRHYLDERNDASIPVIDLSDSYCNDVLSSSGNLEGMRTLKCYFFYLFMTNRRCGKC